MNRKRGTAPAPRREPGDTPAERRCRRSACWASPVLAVVGAGWLAASAEDGFVEDQVDALRGDGSGILTGYLALLLAGTVLLGAVALRFRPRDTRWGAGFAALAGAVAWGALLWRISGMVADEVPEIGTVPGTRRLDPGAFYPAALFCLLVPPAVLVLSGKLFERVRTDLATPAKSRPGTAYETFWGAGVFGALIGGGILLTGLSWLTVDVGQPWRGILVVLAIPVGGVAGLAVFAGALWACGRVRRVVFPASEPDSPLGTDAA